MVAGLATVYVLIRKEYRYHKMCERKKEKESDNTSQEAQERERQGRQQYSTVLFPPLMFTYQLNVGST